MPREFSWLEEVWDRSAPHLPRVRRGARQVDGRRMICGMIHMLKAGARWCDCPSEHGPYTTIYNRFDRWSRQGVWRTSSRP